jgi:transaldolase
VLQLFELGLAMLGAVKGSVIIFLDTRLHGSKIDMVNEARALVGLFDRADVRRWRVVITVMYPQSCAQPFFDRPQLPATEEGIRAAQILTSKYSIGVHLSMVTSLAHACACIEAGASMLSMNVAPVSTPPHAIKPSLKVGSAIRS